VGMGRAGVPGLMALPPRLRARPNEHGASNTAGIATLVSAQSWSNQYWVGVEFAHSVRCQWGCAEAIELKNLRYKMCWLAARSRWLPSNRAGLSVIGEHSIPQSFAVGKELTIAGDGYHRRNIRRQSVGEGIVRVHNVGAV